MNRTLRSLIAAVLSAALALPAPLAAQSASGNGPHPYNFRIKILPGPELPGLPGGEEPATPPPQTGTNEEGVTVSAPSAFANYRPEVVRNYTVTSSDPATTYELVGAPSYVAIDQTSGRVVTTAPPVAANTPIPPYAIRAVPTQGSPIQLSVNNPGIVRPMPGIVTEPTATANVGAPFNHPYAIAGSSEANPTATVVGNLPAGLAIAPGAITGTPTEPGSYTVVLLYEDPLDGAMSGYATVQIEVILGPSFTFQSAESPVGSGRVGFPYSVTVLPRDADGTLAFSVVPTGDAPLTLAQTGLSINAQTGEISGFPSAALTGRMNVRMAVTNGGATTSVDNVLTVAIDLPSGGPDLYPVSVVAHTKHIPNAVTGNIREVLYDNLSTTGGGPHVTQYAGDAAVYTFTYASEVAIHGVGHGITSGTIKVTSLTTGQSREFYAMQGLNVNTNQVFGQSETILPAALYGSSFQVETAAGTSGLRLLQYKEINGRPKLWSPLVNTVGGLTRSGQYTDPDGVFYTGAYTQAQVGYQQYKRINNVEYMVDAELSLAGATWGVNGDLPPGMSMQDGLLSGTPTRHGDYAFGVYAIQANGIRTLDGTVEFKVRAHPKAQAEYPAITGMTPQNGEASPVGALMDADSASYATLAGGATATLTFSRPITADQITIAASSGSVADLELRAADQASELSAGAVTAKRTFSGPVSSTAWTLRNPGAGAVGISVLKLAHGATAGVTAPSVAGGPTPTYIAGTAIAPYQIVRTNGQGAVSFQHVAGTIPPGLSVNAATGRLEGTPTEAGDFSYQVAATDSLGAQSTWKTLTTTILSGVTAATKYPLISGLSGHASDAEATAAAYDADYGTRVTAPANADLTFTFDEPVTANQVYVQFVSGTVSGVYVTPEGSPMAYASGTSGTFNMSAPKTARVWTVRVPIALSAYTVKLRYNGAAPTAPAP